MGISSSNPLASFKKFSRERGVKLFVAGLDAAGKTSMMYRLKNFQQNSAEFEYGVYNYCENIWIQNIYFINLDLGGVMRFKDLFQLSYQENIKGIIFVVDSSDRDRIEDAKSDFQEILRQELLSGIPVLILANKQDLPGVMTVDEIKEKFELFLIRGRSWYLQGCSMITNNGLSEGLEWLSRAIQSDS
ncbi:unnamed protein product [Blepharisma stoltei]|uniref:ADP-ribosylation factor n=1 Tax=Blepharisma stoltei TaxID=1481888 RepID=A0AAU9ILG7_9CILI|nr:unnamed protein product [Blepharisma stoltei]